MPSQPSPYTTTTPPQTTGQAPTLKVKTSIKAGNNPVGSTGTNHNETLVRTPRPATGLKVKTHIKAGFPPGPSRA